MCVISNAAIGFLLLYNISKPFNLIKRTLFISMITLFILQIVFLREVFALVLLKPIEIICLLLVLLLSIKVFKYFVKLYQYVVKKYPKLFN